MKHAKWSIGLLLWLFSSSQIRAQTYNPYKGIGKKAKILTASKGKYVEVFDYDTIQRIGSVLINIRTKKVVRLLNAKATFKKRGNNTVSSRWFSPDPFSEKYYGLSPYNFCANNPLYFVDPGGDSLVLSGAAGAINDFKTTVNQGLGGAFTVTTTATGKYILTPTSGPILNADGSVALSATEASLALLDDGQTTFYNAINRVMTDKSDASFDVINESSKLSSSVPVGDNGQSELTATPGTHTIDMGDIKQFGSINKFNRGLLTSQGALTHELIEGYNIQIKGASIRDAHLAGIQNEGNVNGYPLQISKPAAGGAILVPVVVGDKVVNVSITFTDGNIAAGGITNNTR